MKVLVAEDDTLLSSILVSRFERSAFEPVATYDGEETMEKVRSLMPGLVLLDILMPKKDGFAILEEMKKDAALSKIPVIVLSNLGEKNDVERAKKLGALDYMVKANTTPQNIVEKIQAMRLAGTIS